VDDERAREEEKYLSRIFLSRAQSLAAGRYPGHPGRGCIPLLASRPGLSPVSSPEDYRARPGIPPEVHGGSLLHPASARAWTGDPPDGGSALPALELCGARERAADVRHFKLQWDLR
jgi:hypothetical protein